MKIQRVHLKLLFGTLAAYVLFAAGYVDTVDADPSILTAKSLYQNLEFSISPDKFSPDLYTEGTNNRIYSKMGMLVPVMYVPAIFAADKIAPKINIAKPKIEKFFVSMVNPVLCSLLVLMCFSIFSLLGHSRQQAILLALSVGFSSIILPYSKTSHREILQAIALMGSSIVLIRNRPNQFQFILASSAATLGIWCKMSFCIPLFPIFIATLIKGCTLRMYKNLFFYSLIFFSGLCLQSTYTLLTFGSAFSSGYSASTSTFSSWVWSTPFWIGVYKQLISPQTGLLYFSPICILILSFFSAKVLTRRASMLDAVVVCSFLLQVAFYACWWTPLGGNTLGPRYLVVVVPLLFLTLHNIPNTKAIGAYYGRAMIFFILLWSTITQIVNTSIKPQQYWTMKQRSPVALKMPHWLANANLFYNKAVGAPEKYSAGLFGGDAFDSISLSDVESLQGFNFWWLHLSRHTKTNSLL